VPVSIVATAKDVCPVRVDVSGVECGKPGAPGSGGCRTETNGNTVTILGGGAAGTVIRWTATATDAAGNSAVAACQTRMVGPPPPSSQADDPT
jgi:hypothetical protein